MSPTARDGARRTRGAVALAGLLSAGLLLVLGTRVWVDAEIDTGIARQQVPVTGSEAAAAVTGCALVLGAATVAVLSVRGLARTVSAVALVLAALAALVLSVRVALDPGQVAAEVSTGLPGGLRAVLSAQSTLVPWLAAVAAVPGVLAGLAALRAGRSWGGLSARFDAPGQGAQPGPRGEATTTDDPPAQAWDRLSEGEDPTA